MATKTIEVSEEMYDALIELSKEINNQDHRGTAMPYFFQVRTDKKEPRPNHDAEIYIWADNFGENTYEDSAKGIKDYCEIHDLDLPENFKEIEEDGITADWLIEEFFTQDDVNLQKYGFSIEQKLSNAFLTSKACDEHIQANGYHYDNPVNYLSHAFRNPELELVFKFLCELTGGTIHK